MSDKRKKKQQDPIEAAAKALWVRDVGDAPWLPSWDDTDKVTREEYRAAVTVVIEAWLKAVKP